MHNAESVRPATRDRVLQAIQTLNYVPDLSARKMRAQGRKPSTLAVLAQDKGSVQPEDHPCSPSSEQNWF